MTLEEYCKSFRTQILSDAQVELFRVPCAVIQIQIRPFGYCSTKLPDYIRQHIDVSNMQDNVAYKSTMSCCNTVSGSRLHPGHWETGQQSGIITSHIDVSNTQHNVAYKSTMLYATLSSSQAIRTAQETHMITSHIIDTNNMQHNIAYNFCQVKLTRVDFNLAIFFSLLVKSMVK